MFVELLLSWSRHLIAEIKIRFSTSRGESGLTRSWDFIDTCKSIYKGVTWVYCSSAPINRGRR